MVAFGIKTSQPGASFEELLEAWREAERHGFTSAWIYDHLTALGDPSQPTLEAWTLLAALAARTEKIRIGVLVTDASLRHPAVLAREALTVDHISGGRLEMGLGAGNPRSQIDYDSYHIHNWSLGERIGRLAETAQIVKRLWTEESVDFAGRYYRLDRAQPHIWPVQKPHPPIWIGGKGDRMLRLIARHADGWNYTGPVEQFADTRDRLFAACRDVGRDPSSLRLSAQFFVGSRDADEVRADVEQLTQAGADELLAIIERPFTATAVERAAKLLLR